jgi:hypothetical protein
MVLGYCAGVPGLEPRLTEPESAGLPITPYPITTGVRIPQKLKRYRRGNSSQRRIFSEQLHRLKERW